MSYSTKERTTFLKTTNFDKKSPLNFTTRYQLDIQKKSKPLMRLKNIIGGQECEVSSRIMLKDAESVNNSR